MTTVHSQGSQVYNSLYEPVLHSPNALAWVCVDDAFGHYRGVSLFAVRLNIPPAQEGAQRVL